MFRALLVISLFAAPAFAQPGGDPIPPPSEPTPPPDPAPPPPPAPTPSPMMPAPPPEPLPEMPVLAPPPIVQSILPGLFATSPGLTIEVRLDYSDIDNVDVTILNTFARAQYVTPQGYGGYVAIPFAYVEEVDDEVFGIGGTGIGNIEVGGLYVTKTSKKTDLLLRGGISIDTTSEDDEFAVAISTVLPRLIDTYTSGLETTWGRAQAQIRHASNNLRLGAAIGMDTPIAGDGADQDGFVGVVNGMLSAGLQQGQMGLGMTFTMLQPITDGEDENVSGLSLGGDYLINPSARMFVQIGFSLEDNSDGTSFGFGVRSTIN